jgi:hypothetical protein
MATRYKDHLVTRGDPWLPKPIIVYPSVASFSHYWCTARKRWATLEPDDLDDNVVGQITMAGGGIIALDGTRIQLNFPSATTRLWTLGEYVYDVQARLIADNEPYTLVRGKLTMRGVATQTP